MMTAFFIYQGNISADFRLTDKIQIISSMYFVYILFSNSLGRYYIGYTKDLTGRVTKHNRNHKGYTSVGKPWKMVYFECFNTKKEALIREAKLKQWKNKNRIRDLINNSGSEHPD